MHKNICITSLAVDSQLSVVDSKYSGDMLHSISTMVFLIKIFKLILIHNLINNTHYKQNTRQFYFVQKIPVVVGCVYVNMFSFGTQT